MQQEKRPTYFAWFVLPSVLLALALTLSLATLFQYSFRLHVPGSLQVGGFTLENFSRMGSWVYLHVFVDSLVLSAWTALVSLLLGYPLAHALVRSRAAWLKTLILVVFVVPMFTGDIVRTYSWLIVLGKNGFLNGALRAVGLIETPIELLYTATGVTIALVQYALPVMVIMLAAAISHIDVAVEKAAASLGAPPAAVFLRITLPLSLPGILSGSVTIFAWTLSAFATPQLVGGGKVNMISNLVYQLGFSNFDFPFAAVLSMTALVLTVAILMALSRLMRGLERYGIQH